MIRIILTTLIIIWCAGGGVNSFQVPDAFALFNAFNLFNFFDPFEARAASLATCGIMDSLNGPVEVLRLKLSGPGGPEKGDKATVRQVLFARKGMPLNCSDVVLTREGAQAKIKFKGPSILNLGPNTRITLEDTMDTDNSSSLLHLVYGKVRTFFQSRNPTHQLPPQSAVKNPLSLPTSSASPSASAPSVPFRIRTSTAVAGVRGTDFYLSFEPNTQLTEQATLSGQVEVEQIGSGQKVIVASGKQVLVEQVRSEGKEKKDSAMESAKNLKPLEVKPIETSVISEIKQTSSLVKSDQEFQSPETLKVLGTPADWKPPQQESPLDLKDLKEEF